VKTLSGETEWMWYGHCHCLVARRSDCIAVIRTRGMLMSITTIGVGSDVRPTRLPLVLSGVVFVALCLGALAVNLLSARAALQPSAYPPLDALQDYYTGAPAVIRLAALLQFAASLALAAFTAIVGTRLSRVRADLAGGGMALAGGTLAAVFLGLTALGAWALAHPGIDQATLRVMHQFAFAADVGHAGALAVLAFGGSVAALATGLIPRWVCLLGMALAALAAVSTLTLVLPALALLLPIVHILSWLWVIAIAITMSSRR
jgi:hypothetical protein